MTELNVCQELDSMRQTQRAAMRWLFGLLATLVAAFVISASGLMLKVERMDAVMGERFSNIIAAINRLDTTISNVSSKSDSRYAPLEERMRVCERQIEVLRSKLP